LVGVSSVNGRCVGVAAERGAGTCDDMGCEMREDWAQQRASRGRMAPQAGAEAQGVASRSRAFGAIMRMLWLRGEVVIFSSGLLLCCLC